jgi:hypothetical protein
MDRESFLETVKKQYAEEIQEAYVECEHDDGRTVDYVQLNQKLRRLQTGARAQGLAEPDFQELVRMALPEVWDKLSFHKLKAA